MVAIRCPRRQKRYQPSGSVRGTAARLTRAVSGGVTRLRIWHLALPLLALAGAAQAAQAKVIQAPASSCEQAIGEAARSTQVPSRLMAAIGLVETGRQDPISGAWHPWPWAINAEGAGAYFNSKSEAVAAVRTLQAAGVRSIDVGCMQVNLMHHPDAFATLDEAFDPKHNAVYAAHFLGSLFQRSGNWMIAAGWYHSTTADLAAEYAKRVSAIMPGGKPGPLLTRDGFIATPIIGRDGMLLPSVRLNASGLVPPHSVSQYPGTAGKPGVRARIFVTAARN
jgi:hypothetical protein